MSVANQLLQTINKSMTDKSIMIRGVKMEVVHVSEDELDALDRMQHGSYMHNGIPEYSRIAPLIRSPAVRQIFMQAANISRSNPQVANKMRKKVKRMDGRNFSNHPMPNPLARNTADEGVDGDKKIAYFPVDLCNFLDQLRGGSDFNKHTKLRQYDFFDDILGIAAPVVGALGFGPIGALGGAMFSGAFGGGGGGGGGLGGLLGNGGLGGLLKGGDGLASNVIGLGLGAMNWMGDKELSKQAEQNRVKNNQMVHDYVGYRGFL